MKHSHLLILFLFSCLHVFSQGGIKYCGTTSAASGSTESSSSQNCAANNVTTDFGNEFYIPDENSPILTININIHVPWHPYWEANGRPNYQEGNEAHEKFLAQIIADAEEKIFSDPGSPELCFWATTNAPLMIDSKIRLKLNEIYFHEDSAGVINDGSWCGSYLYTTYVAGDPVLSQDLNIFFIEANTTSGGCGPGYFGEASNYIIIPNTFQDFLQDPAFWAHGPNVAHEINHCLGLHHTCETSQQNLFEFECITTCWDFSNSNPNELPYDHGINHNMTPFSSLQKYMTPLQFGHMRRLLLTGWRSKLLETYPANPETIVIDQPTVWSDDITWYGDIEIKSGGELTILNSTLTMQDDNRIFVKRGAKLIIDGGTITSCDEKDWRGVLVEGAGKLLGQLMDPFAPTSPSYAGTVIMINGATIENAINGISTRNPHLGYPAVTQYYGGLIYCDGAFFTNCNRAVEIMKYGTPDMLDRCSFNNTTFENLNLGVTNWASDGVTITKCTFQDIAKSATGGLNAAINVYDGNKFINVNIGVSVTATKINELSPQIGLDGTEPNEFISGAYGVYATSVNNLELMQITNNVFETNVGVFVDGPGSISCVKNDFEGTGQGQAFFAIDTDDNFVDLSDNHFNNKGIPITILYNNKGLVFSKNTMDNSTEFDVWLFGTSGNPGIIKPHQGNFISSAGNCFSKGGITEIFTDNTTASFKYAVMESMPTSRPYPAVTGNFLVVPSISNPNSTCESGTESQAPEPPIVAGCNPSSNIALLINEIQNLDGEIASLKSRGASEFELNDTERCLNYSLNKLAKLYAENSDYTASNIYFAGRPEFSKRVIPYSNRIQVEDYAGARSYLNTMSTSSTEEVDFVTSQNLYLDFVQSTDYILSPADRLFLKNTGESPGPLNGYARSVYHSITEEHIQIPMPAVPRPKQQTDANASVKQLQLFPNPLTGRELMIKGIGESQEFTVTIYDLNGKIIQSSTQNGDGICKLKVITAGIYFVQISSQDNILHKEKLIILD